MIIQNKKSGQRTDVTQAQWDTIKQAGFGRHWIIISHDAPLEEPKTMPLKLTEFSKITKKPHGRRSKNN